jgi:filamentous hemagglutinin
MGATMATLTFGESVVVGMASAMAGSLASQVVSGNGINFGAVLEAGAIGALTAGIANGITYNPTSGLGFNGLGQSLGAMPAQTSTLGQLAGLSNLTNVLVPGASTAVGSLPQMALAMTAMATLDAGVQTAIGGGSFLNNLKNGAVADVAAAGAYAIGDEAKALTAGLGQVGGELAYTGLHAVLGCAASAAEGTGCAGGAIGGAASAALTPFVANAVTGGDPNITPGQAAAIAGIATLTGGVFAGLAGQNAMAGATAAENEALNNCMGHPETCLQMAKNALNSAGETASNVWTGITNPQPSPNSGFTSAFASAMNAGTNVPGMESETNLDLLKGMGNVGLNLASGSLPGVPDYTPYFQYNNPVVGGIGEMYGLGGASELGAGLLSGSNVASNGPTTLYRAVSPEEYHSIMSTGQFSFAPGAGEMKQFGFNLNEVMNYANTAPNYAAIVQAEIPTSLLGTFGVSNSIDPFIFRSGVLTVEKEQQLNLFNSVVKNVSHAY